ncbi:MAG: ion transporter [Ilumatobacter sp.]|nr:MAG: ion transporter [Ilumatobacter sp.]
MGVIAARCHRLAESRGFQMSILAVIVANAVVIGIETYPAVQERWGGVLRLVDVAFLAIFTVEITIRLLAHGRRPWEFFRGGWNVFDFVIVVLALLPVVGANVTLVRLIRVLRVVRLVEAIDDLRMIVLGLARSLAALAGVAVFVVLVMYVYAVTGTALFGEELPDEWGTAGVAMMTCFRILTLDNWDDLYFPALEVTPWATPYFVSFIIVATLVVLNIVIAVVVSSVEQARQSELERETALVAELAGERAPELSERIVALRAALDQLEEDLGTDR